ncbi:hypothetical protein H310_05357 [Aphanomyces invadans]|uniref:t-SNARE coiled-coil homology domain-containing protein n=1 Tax=Aphanomyces invadans TaxID=157072 RepID=A0A024U9N2_9STRA|nr:hypothetical protein H310_05357 [Aphanomyces invadans]ETW02890.1 hypothetical protein H310_05357 [Aphanomyces invadans]|eukprot:XP_008868274.1 hypothetical protein H310_05357 [Aphanomyces invadans]
MQASLVGKNVGGGASASGDPYYVFKEELETKVSSIYHTHKRWKLLMNDTTSSPTNRFPKTTDDLKKEVASAERSLGFLEQSIRAIESDRTKYAHIDSVELSGRKTFVSSTRQELMRISVEISSDLVKARIQRDERRMLRSSSSQQSNGALASPSPTVDRNSILVDEKTRQQQIVKDQDESLDQLHTSVSRLGHVAVEINSEIKGQNRMLEDLELDVDDTQERMNFVMSRMSRMLKTKDTCQLSGILVLTGVLIVLIFLVIYT